MTSVLDVFNGSDGEATKALYGRLEALGPSGVIALNLFRAQKNSSRAKVYRGGIRGQGSFRSMAYERKQWALGQLASALTQHAGALGLAFGWQMDPETAAFPWVLYVDLPTGQVSFHAASPLSPERYTGAWDGIREMSAFRIVRWVESLLVPSLPVEAAS